MLAFFNLGLRLYSTESGGAAENNTAPIHFNEGCV